MAELNHDNLEKWSKLTKFRQYKMDKIRTVIVDDEEASLFLLKEELYPNQNIVIVAEFRNGKEGLEGINRLTPDLVFVDIEMPGLNGFQMLQRITCNPAIIFCTGHKKYALDAWDYQASDFIIKPIETKRINQALERALEDIKHKRLEERLNKQKLFAGFIELNWSDPNGKKSRYFSPDEIVCIQGDRDYLKFNIIPDVAKELGLFENLISIKQTIKQASKELKRRGFIQIHKSYIINLSKVLEWNRSTREIRLEEFGDSVPIGRAFVKEFQIEWEKQIEHND